MSKGIQLLTINITEDNHVQKNKPTLQANLDKRADKLWTTNQAMHHARRSTHPSCKGKQSNIIEEEEHIHNAWGNTHPLCKRKHPSIMQEKHTTIMQEKHTTIMQEKHTTIMQEKHTTIMQEKHTTIMQEEAYIHYVRRSTHPSCKRKHTPWGILQSLTILRTVFTVQFYVECTSTYVDLSFGSEFGFTFCFSDDSLPGLRFSSGLRDFTLLQG